MTLPEPETLHAIVGRVFRSEDVTLGDPLKNYIARYRGELLLDSVAAYDQLAEALRPYAITPLFRIEGGRQTVILVHGVLRLTLPRVTTNVVLFILTVISVLFAGAMYGYEGSLPSDPWGQVWVLISHLWVGWPFAVSLLGILLAHEFGHYFAGRRHKTAVTLPYFIPLPISILGTMGAFIQMRERPRNKRVLFDIGIAGPLAGLAVAIPVLILGLSLSDVSTVEDMYYTRTANQGEDVCPNTALVGEAYSCATDNFIEGNSLLYLGLKYLVKGELLPAPVRYEQPVFLYWLRYGVTGHPVPLGGRDVMLHPAAMAGWAGILVSFLNLIPAGQLDGGHILYALFDRRVRSALPFVLATTALLGFFWSGWWLWTGIILLLGRAHAEPLDQITQLDPRRKALGALMLAVFLLVLTPVPFTVF